MAKDEAATSRREPTLSGEGMRVAVVCGRFNDLITDRLLEGALGGLDEVGVAAGDVEVCWVPGAFEVPLAAQAYAAAGFDAVVTLGAVIRGETGHYDFVAGECARGIQDVQLATGVPVAFGVLTTDNLEQAMARSEVGGDDKGREAAHVAIEMAMLLRRTRG